MARAVRDKAPQAFTTNRAAMPDNEHQPSSHRPQYRQNDDVRDPIPSDQRSDTKPDSRFDARGDARENVGNNTRGTDADPTGPEGNDNFKQPKRDPQDGDFDADLHDRG
jgi:hypothetical protein